MELNETIKEICKNTTKPLLNVSAVGAKQIREYYIDCSDLEDYNLIDIRNSVRYEPLFKDIKEISGPTLYYFEIISNHSSIEIVNGIREYSLTENSKSIPAIKAKFPDSQILYVGKVKKHMWGRLIQHLGFYKVQFTQGLQLFYWAKDLSLSLKLTVLEFEPEMVNLMEVLENEIAKELKPILGKHK